MKKGDQTTKAFAVFSGQADLPWLRLLKPGFRHCFALVHDGRQWISYDPLASYTELTVHHVPSGFDLPGWLKERGLTVVPAPVNKARRAAPLMPFTCVEAVKRVLGIHARGVFTPWQLYRFLNREDTQRRGRKVFRSGFLQAVGKTLRVRGIPATRNNSTGEKSWAV